VKSAVRPSILYPLFASVTSLKGVGPATVQHLKRLTGDRVVDLYWHLPSGVLHRRWIDTLSQAKSGETITAILTVAQHFPSTSRFSKSRPYKVACQDDQGHFMDLIFFHTHPDQLLKLLPSGSRRLISGKFEDYQGRVQMIHPEHIGLPQDRESWCGVEGLYPLTYGLTQNHFSKILKRALERCPVLPEWIEESRLKTQGWKSWQDSLREVHHPQNLQSLEPNYPARRRIAYDQLLSNQLALLLVRRSYSMQPGQSFKGDGNLRNKLHSLLPFQLTNAQNAALKDIYTDMASPTRMIRLLQGDVGSGKTVVAMLAMLNAVECGYQAALLAPTEILTRQHFATLSPWAEALGLKIGILTGRGKDKKATLAAVAEGQIDILIGTHALFQDQVAFKNLGVAVIDEQHRFGVDQRLSLSAKGDKIDLLVMTATPIPRTLLLAAYGDLATSRLDEKPPGRQDIETCTIPLSRLDDVIQGVKRALDARRKVYWICPLVEESESLDLAAAEVRFQELDKIFPGQVGLVHGRMKAPEKDAAMQSFITGQTRLLVATTVIEVGVHIPDATIMVIEHAERFGLSQLHQLRGRIGRGIQASTCLLLFEQKGLRLTAKARLNIMRSTNDGFKIAEEDLRLRGGGDPLGLRQSGLPALKLVDYALHADLLDLAHQDAEAILSIDPTLSSERGKALQILLHLFERQRTVAYMQSG
jgi:ATP-dependent DNA helicase RecG